MIRIRWNGKASNSFDLVSFMCGWVGGWGEGLCMRISTTGLFVFLEYCENTTVFKLLWFQILWGVWMQQKTAVLIPIPRVILCSACTSKWIRLCNSHVYFFFQMEAFQANCPCEPMNGEPKLSPWPPSKKWKLEASQKTTMSLFSGKHNISVVFAACIGTSVRHLNEREKNVCVWHTNKRELKEKKMCVCDTQVKEKT